MTHNQIEYWNLVETRRHNLAGEGETQRHNVAGEQENTRHNKAFETIEIGKLNETVRHNTATEYETNRHNVETENIGYGQLNEQVRHNRTTESIQSMDAQTRLEQLRENTRHNKMMETIGATQAASSAVDTAGRFASSYARLNNRSSSVIAGIGSAAATKRAASKVVDRSGTTPFIVLKPVLKAAELGRIRPNSKKGDYES